MTDIPIIFSATMIQALFAGRKTMTRRVAWRAWRRTQPGDRLWVREGLSQSAGGNWQYAADAVPIRMMRDDRRAARMIAWAHHKEGKHCPSIRMPRWASRLTLTVTAVKVERLQDISEADAQAEGIEGTEFWRDDHPPSICFSVLWNALHGPDAWSKNPEVVALSFSVQQQNIDTLQAAA